MTDSKTPRVPHTSKHFYWIRMYYIHDHRLFSLVFFTWLVQKALCSEMWTVPVIWGTSFCNRLIATLCHDWHFTDAVVKSHLFHEQVFLQHNHYINAFSKLHRCLKDTRWITDQRTKHTTVSRRERLVRENLRLRCSICIDVFVMSSERYHLSCHFKGFPHTAEDHGCERSSFIQWPHATWFSYLTKLPCFACVIELMQLFSVLVHLFWHFAIWLRRLKRRPTTSCL